MPIPHPRVRATRTRFLAAVLLTVSPATLLAQRRDDFARAPELRRDVTIFSPLDLPTPTRLRSASGAPGPDYWQQRADYRIAVALDPATRTVTGKEHVTYHNNSPDALDYLWVHLEQNVLKKDSIGSLTDGGAAVGERESENSDGVLLSHVGIGGTDLTYHVYDTMMRVELPQPLLAGKQLEFDVAWSFHVPEHVFRRYGTMKVRKGTIWEIAQWFPAVAVYDDVHGWNTLPYIGTGEFYFNFGNVDLDITVPRDHIVVASGVLQNPEEVFTSVQLERLAAARKSRDTVMIRDKDEVGDPASRPAGQGPLTWRFRAENVRTVAFASSEAFMLDACAAGATLVQSAYSEDSIRTWSKSTQMLRTAIEGYSKQWFPYPYPVATNVGGVEGGMEYPMIIFCSGRSRGDADLYGVTTHEIGHNWFPMLVNTDERRYAWMDEGFNTFINKYSTQEWFPNRKPPRPSSFAGMLKAPGVPVVTNADRLTGLQLGVLQYEKTGVGLMILREYILGDERFDYAFRTYIRRWAFKSPQPADFFRTMEDASGMDLAWFWRGWFLEDAMLDQAVDRVQQPSGNRGARITFVNKERQVMPLTFRATFEDGSTEVQRLPVEMWFQSDRVAVTLEGKGTVTEMRIDPDQMLPDTNRRNNIWTGGE
ncbi:MAG TPA: M1 family metallopeptidase [Planctomycetota bacterium]|nr:M1 family metallopeptidase [Planctomycetota bacterium]